MRTNAELRELLKNKELDGFLLRDEKDAIVGVLPALLDRIDALEA